MTTGKEQLFQLNTVTFIAAHTVTCIKGIIQQAGYTVTCLKGIIQQAAVRYSCFTHVAMLTVWVHKRRVSGNHRPRIDITTKYMYSHLHCCPYSHLPKRHNPASSSQVPYSCFKHIGMRKFWAHKRRVSGNHMQRTAISAEHSHLSLLVIQSLTEKA